MILITIIGTLHISCDISIDFTIPRYVKIHLDLHSGRANEKKKNSIFAQKEGARFWMLNDFDQL